MLLEKNSDKVLGILEEKYKDNMSENDALKYAIDAMLQYVETGSKNMERSKQIIFNKNCLYVRYSNDRSY